MKKLFFISAILVLISFMQQKIIFGQIANTKGVLSKPNINSGWVIMPFSTPYPVRSIHFYDANTGCINNAQFYFEDSIRRTSDGGNNWTLVRNTQWDPWAYNVYTSAYQYSGPRIFVTEKDETFNMGHATWIVMSENMGLSWIKYIQLGPSLNGHLYVFKNLTMYKNIGFVVAQDMPFPPPIMWRTIDGGVTWNSYTTMIDTNFIVNSPSYYELNSNIVFALYNGIVKSTDMGANFSLNKTGGYASICVVDSNTVIAVGGSEIIRSTDLGVSWTSGTLNASLNKVKFPDAFTGYITGSGGAVFKSTNKGLNWIQQESPTTESLIDFHFINANTGYAVGNWGTLIKTTTGGTPMPVIMHTPLQSTQNLSGPYVVNASISETGNIISGAKVFWSRNNTAVTDSITMTNSSGSNWSGSIPGNGQPATYRYCIRAADTSGRISYVPENAPSTLYSFVVTAPDTIKPAITHTPLSNMYISDWPAVVYAGITDNTGIDSVWVSWYKRPPQTFAKRQFQLNNTGGNNWAAYFNSYNGETNLGDTLFYRIFAQDNSTNHNRDSSSLYSFRFYYTSDTIKPVITHTPIQNIAKSMWPVSVSATVTDNRGLDSVWVKWYKRPPDSFKSRTFKLINTEGNVFSAQFNATNSEVNFFDTIYYKIIAQDSSANHNRDSSALYSFILTNQTVIIAGTGTNLTNYPFTTVFPNARTQTLFYASELNPQRSSFVFAISRLGYDVAAVGSPPILNNFSVKFQHTNLTALSGYVNSGWTTVFSGTYTVSGTGWQYIELPQPYFLYNGTSNLLVEICFSNTGSSTNSPVRSTSTAGATYAYYSSSSGCTLPTGYSQPTRANTSFTMTIITGGKTDAGIIPDKFSLSQNYPNPFNPVTRIEYAIPKRELVTLKIFDILGRVVSTPVNEVKSAGYYSADFNASDLPSGIYFYRITAGEFSEVRKMVLVK